MFTGLNLSRRDAIYRVSQYMCLWLLFWLLLGSLGGFFGGADVGGPLSSAPLAHDAQTVDGSANTPEPPRLLPQTDHLIVRGQINRAPGQKVGARAQDSPRTSASQRQRGDISKGVSGGEAAGLPVNVAKAPKVSGSGGFTAGAPPGFEDLIGVQNTQADVYFQGRPLISTFVEFDLEYLEFMAPEEVVDAIPTLKNPGAVLASISGELERNSDLLCNVRVRTNCGFLAPQIAGVIFDEGKFRVHLFVAAEELEVQLVVGERYLPAPTASFSTLHDLSLSASGQFNNDRYNFAGESFLSRGESRARVRYGLTNNGPALHEASLQWDKRDREFELGAFRSARGNSVFVNDRRLLGVRLGSSTKTRTDLDNALATPIFIFLERRARVDILRDGEILDSRFYDAGNHQLDTARLPDGAYDITVKTVAADGSEAFESHLFVRDSLLPPLGEQQFFVEAGAFTQAYGSSLPRTTGGGWLRAGASRRLSDSFALEAETLLSGEVSLLQAGAYFLGRGWQLHAGAMASERGDSGFSLRGRWQRKGYGLSVNAQHLNSKTPFQVASRFDPLVASNIDFDADELIQEQFATQSVLGGSFTQASVALSFPLRIPLFRGRFSQGRANVRARYNKRGEGIANAGIGFNYYAPLFKRRKLAADLNFEGLYSNNRSLVRLGVDFRWRDRGQSSLVRPELVASQTVNQLTQERSSTDFNPALSAFYNRNVHTENFGDISENLYLNHNNARSVFGTRLSSQSKYGFSELDLAYQDSRQGSGRDGLSYATNSRFSLVSTGGRSALGGGSSQLAAIVVEIDGNLPGRDFKVIVDSRVAGYASSDKRAVVSVRPYETYTVKIQPAGDSILGYDERSVDVTLFPGNVHRLVFAAHALHVLVSQAVLPDGTPVSHGKFLNVEGYGATDNEGWFQVELAHRDALQVRLSSGDYCELIQPPEDPEGDDLAVVDALVCRSIPAPPAG